MCFPSFRGLVWFILIVVIISVILSVAGPHVFAVPAMAIAHTLPKPHVTFTYDLPGGSVKLGIVEPQLEAIQIDLEDVFKKAGYLVQQGTFVTLSNGTCAQCMGSPAAGNPHVVLAFEEEEKTEPSCYYNGTLLSYCFHLESDEALVIVSTGAKYYKLGEFSWGFYLFDTLDTNGRALIQAGLGYPIRPKKSDAILILLSYLPEMLDMLKESLQLPGIEEKNVYAIPLSTSVIQTDLAPVYNDRLSVIVKMLPKSDEEFSNEGIEDIARAYKIRIRDQAVRGQVRQGKTYSRHKYVGFTPDSMKTEQGALTQYVEIAVKALQEIKTVVQVSPMISPPEVLGVQNAQDCVQNKINCLAEDWDLVYTASIGIILPENGMYTAVLIGVDHPEGRRITLGLYDAEKNQELLDISHYLEENEMLYALWLSRNCSKEFSPCVNIAVGDSQEFFLRERVYGATSYAHFAHPVVLIIKNF